MKTDHEPEIVYWVEYENGAIGVWTSFGWHWEKDSWVNTLADYGVVPVALYIPGYGWARRKVREENQTLVKHDPLGLYKNIKNALRIKGYDTDSVSTMDREAFNSYMQSLKDVPRTVEEVRV